MFLLLMMLAAVPLSPFAEFAKNLQVEAVLNLIFYE